MSVQFACCFLLKPTEDVPDGGRSALLPCLVGTKEFRKVAMVLVGSIPPLPVGLVHEVTNVPVQKELATLRVSVPRALVSEEGWKVMKSRPVGLFDAWKGSLEIHSSYGWSENKLRIGNPRMRLSLRVTSKLWPLRLTNS